jgi:ATPase subunit of ABC transporter with duplicated ATPase domains
LNGSDWRLAISDWQIVGVAISHDEKAARRKRQQMAISEWRLGKRQRVAKLLEWLSATTKKAARQKTNHDRKAATTRIATTETATTKTARQRQPQLRPQTVATSEGSHQRKVQCQGFP